MNKETGQNKNPSDRNEGIKAIDKKPYTAPNITFIEDLEVVAGICGDSGKSAADGCGGTVNSWLFMRLYVDLKIVTVFCGMCKGSVTRG